MHLVDHQAPSTLQEASILLFIVSYRPSKRVAKSESKNIPNHPRSTQVLKEVNRIIYWLSDPPLD